MHSCWKILLAAACVAAAGCSAGTQPFVPGGASPPGKTGNASGNASSPGTANRFTYAGTYARTIARYSPPPNPAPSGTPVPYVVSHEHAGIAQTVRVLTAQTFDGTSGLTDVRASETDTGDHATVTSTTNDYV